MIYNLKVIKLQVVSLVTIKSIILVLFLNCSSAKRNQSQKEIQNAIFEITDHHFGSFIENSKEGYVWINNKIHIETALSKFDSIDFVKRTQIEWDFINDTILGKEILTPENIKFFKEQINNHDYNLVSKKLRKNPKVKVVPPDVSRRFYDRPEDIFLIPSIMFTKDGKYALVYYSKTHAYGGLQVYKKEKDKWVSFRGLAVYIS